MVSKKRLILAQILAQNGRTLVRRTTKLAPDLIRWLKTTRDVVQVHVSLSFTIQEVQNRPHKTFG
jgi:hypothetical protein